MLVKALFATTRAKLVPEMDLSRMQENITIHVTADQANEDVDPINNKVQRTINVKLKNDVNIFADTSISDQVLYKQSVTSTRKLRLYHRFTITNNGPSFMPKTHLMIKVPVSNSERTFAVLKNTPSTCAVVSGQGKLDQTTSATPTVQTTALNIDVSGAQMKKRDVESKAESKTSSKTTTVTSKGKQIACAEKYDCVILKCQVGNLERFLQHSVVVTIDVFESAIAAEKDFREVLFITEAIVADPSTWHEGKIVPWNTTVHVEKCTTLIVEPDSVVSEISIWIIIGSVIGAIVLLAIVIFFLWKCGFFRRKKQAQLRELKRDMLYKRIRMRVLAAADRKGQQSSTPVDDLDTVNGDRSGKDD